tara:strand:- start:1026 stop:1286 length:261 start_codon:yes stop_codon:yes gene_type:complete
MMSLRKGYLQSTYNYFLSQRDNNVLDLEVYLENPVGVGEHSDIGAEIQKKIEAIDKYDSILGTMISRFGEEMIPEEEKDVKNTQNN